VLPDGLGAETLVTQVAGACALLASAGLTVELPPSWAAPLITAVRSLDGTRLDPKTLVPLAEAALTSDEDALGYAISHAGLNAEGEPDAFFMFLRARCLVGQFGRESRCLSAALHLARRQRNQALVHRIADELQEVFPGPPDGDMSDREVDEVLAEEKSNADFPDPFDTLGQASPLMRLFLEGFGLNPEDLAPSRRYK
jgi:hypothetical protein